MILADLVTKGGNTTCVHKQRLYASEWNTQERTGRPGTDLSSRLLDNPAKLRLSGRRIPLQRVETL